MFYGWWIVLAGVAVQLVVSGLFTHAYGAYVVMMRAELGWSATLLSFGYSLLQVEVGAIGPLQGWLVDRHGPRRVVSAGILLVALGLLLLSQVFSPEAFLAAICVIAIGHSLSGMESLRIAVVNWFALRRSTALGVISVGAHGGALLLPLVVVGLTQLGWRTTAALSALAIAAFALPAAQRLRRSPEAHGLVPDGRSVDPSGLLGAGTSRAAPAFTVHEALRTPQFWLLSFGHACAALAVSATLVHMVPHLSAALGLGLGEASAYAVLLSGLTIAGTLIGGLAGDRFGRGTLLVGSMVAHALGILSLAHASAAWMVITFALLHGSAWGVRGPVTASIRADYFGRSAYGSISGWSSVIVMLGGLAGPLVAGVAFDSTGSYTAGFDVVALICALGAALFLLGSRTAPRSDPPVLRSATSELRSA